MGLSLTLFQKEREDTCCKFKNVDCSWAKTILAYTDKQHAFPQKTHRAQIIVQDRLSTRVAHAPDLLQQTGSGEVTLPHPFIEISLEGIQLAAAFTRLEDRHSLAREYLPYSITGTTRQPGYRPDRMSLSGQMFYVHVLI
jgi:hypothetical protein